MAHGSNTDWPDWITAACAVLAALAVPIGVLLRRIFGSVTRKELRAYLQARDVTSEKRHEDNIAELRRIAGDLSDARERLSHIEGELTGNRRGPPR